MEKRFSDVVAGVRLVEKTAEMAVENARLVNENRELERSKERYKAMAVSLRHTLEQQNFAMSPALVDKKRKAEAMESPETGEFFLWF